MIAPDARNVAVVIAAHGDRGGEGMANRTLHAHCDALRAGGHFRCVSAGVLKGEPSIETAFAEAVASGAAGIAVYPFFMADGYFAGTVLPKRIEAAGHTIPVSVLKPLGLDPRLPELILGHALAAAESAGLIADTAQLLIVGHGSEIARASAEATARVGAALRTLGQFRDVAIALLEEPPFVPEVLAAATGPVVVTGFFSGDGLHAGEDIPTLLSGARTRTLYAGAIGQIPAIAGLMRDAIFAELSGL